MSETPRDPGADDERTEAPEEGTNERLPDDVRPGPDPYPWGPPTGPAPSPVDPPAACGLGGR